MALNLVSLITMVQIDKVRSNLMVDVNTQLLAPILEDRL